MNRYLTLAEYLWLAEQVTGTDPAVLAKASHHDLADSALHAPQAGFGDEEFYPDIFDKAAVLVCRLTWNHPLVEGSLYWEYRSGEEIVPLALMVRDR